jgi:hypothetical protein
MKHSIYSSLLIIAFLFVSLNTSFAQYSLNKGWNNLEISGSTQLFYNYRFYKPEEKDRKKNRFELDYAQINFKGVASKKFRYAIELNPVGFYNAEDPDNGFVNEATVSYRTPNQLFEIKAGYQKIPFSRYSLLSREDLSFLQRPELARGDVFTRRDMGVVLKTTFWEQKIAIYTSVFNGTGELTLQGDNDASGNVEVAGRVELNYPSPMDETSIDKQDITQPVVAIGVNARHSDKVTEEDISEYGFKTIVGTKTGVGADIAAKYRGWVASFEIVNFTMTPDDTASTFLNGKPTNYFKAGGMIAELSYYVKKLRTAFAIRYDDFNPNDLTVKDTRKNISGSIAHYMQGNTTLRLHYWHRLDLEATNKPWADDQIRLAWLLQF